MSRTVLGCMGCALLLALTTACLADKTLNVPSGDWATAGSWTPSGVPTVSDTAFVNNGGTVTVSASGATCDGLRVENGSLSVAGVGTTLNAYELLAGASNTGSVTHSGGTVTLNSSLSLGSVSGFTGQYTLSGTGTLQSLDEYVGDVGGGTFTQNASTSANNLSGWMYVGKSGSGTYTMNAGAFTALDNFVGYGGSGSFTQSGGTSTMSGSLQLGYLSTGNGTFSISGGNLTTADLIVGLNGSGTFNISNSSAAVTVSRLLNLGVNSHLIAASGSKMSLGNASVQNTSTTASNLSSGLENVSMYFGTATVPTVPSFLEAACQDKSTDSSGYTTNFALGGLYVGDGANPGYVKLVDDVLNITGGTTDEALYVRNLVITAGSTLDLNGLHLYYDTFTGSLSNITGGGIVTQLNAPAAHTYLPADFNQDFKVSFADYLILEANFGKSGLTNATGDANGDGKCSFADYLILEAEFGHTTTPEPATMGLLLLGGLAMLRRKA